MPFVCARSWDRWALLALMKSLRHPIIHVFSDQVTLEVDLGPRAEGAQVGGGERRRDELDLEGRGGERGDGQADAVDGDRSFGHEEGAEIGRERDLEPLARGPGGDPGDRPHAV